MFRSENPEWKRRPRTQEPATRNHRTNGSIPHRDKGWPAAVAAVSKPNGKSVYMLHVKETVFAIQESTSQDIKTLPFRRAMVREAKIWPPVAYEHACCSYICPHV